LIHHWNNITEVKKLTQSVLIPGVIEENIYRNPLLMAGMPVAWTPGQSIKYNRELSEPKGDVAPVGIGDQLTWTSSVTYTQMEVELQRRYIQRLVDNFIPDVYGTINNYEATVLGECKKAMFVDLNDQLVYGDTTFNSGEFDGLHAWAATQAVSTTGGLNTDGEDEGLNLDKLRIMVDTMKIGIDVLYFPFEIARRLSAGVMELGGEVSGVLTTRAAMSEMSFGINDLGKRVMFYGGVSILPTDYLVAEESDTGDDGTEARGKNADAGTSDPTFSIFGIKFGNIYAGVPGLMYGFGDTAMAGDMYRMELFDKLEDYDAKGIRLVMYGSPLLGSKYSLCRCYDVDDTYMKIAG